MYNVITSTKIIDVYVSASNLLTQLSFCDPTIQDGRVGANKDKISGSRVKFPVTSSRLENEVKGGRQQSRPASLRSTSCCGRRQQVGCLLVKTVQLCRPGVLEHLSRPCYDQTGVAMPCRRTKQTRPALQPTPVVKSDIITVSLPALQRYKQNYF